jgi:subtilisin family serine protease
MRVRVLSAGLLASLVLLSIVARGVTAERSVVPAEVHQAAADAGSARVIVRLNMPFVPESALPSGNDIYSQRQLVAALQSYVVAYLAGVDHTVVRRYDALPLLALEASPDALRMLDSLAGVVADVEEDRLHAPTLSQSVPLINANDAWGFGYDGTGTIVAILDTGVDTDHSFFAGGAKVIGEACFSTNTSGIAPDGSPLTATSACPGRASSSTASGSAAPCTANGCNHGTHVAGIAAGAGSSFSGVAKGAKLMAIQVFSTVSSSYYCGASPCPLSYTSDQIAALNYVYNQRNSFPGYRVASANMSLGGGGYTGYCDTASQKPAIDQLRAAGIATVIAAGNSYYYDGIASPGCISSAISVGSTTKSNTISPFSNMAYFVTVLAPGSSIYSSLPGTGYGTLSGTSMAAPHVAGTMAILRQAVPSASVSDLVSALQNTGVYITDTRGGIPPGEESTRPRIDVLAALDDLGALDSIQFSAGTYSVNENAGPATITLTRTGPAIGTATVRVSTSNGTATAGSDYVAITSQLVTFNPGETTKSFNVSIVNDFVIEPDETMNLALASPTGAVLGSQRTATLTILNDDQPGAFAFSAATYSVTEGTPSASITVTRSGGLAAGASVRYATSNGTAIAGQDYAAVAGVLSFAGGQTSKTFTVPITNDTLNEPDETVNLTLSTPGGGATLGSPSTATLTIVDNDPAGTVQFSAPTYTVSEAAATVTLTVTRTSGTASGVTVRYATSDGSATGGATAGGGVDYLTKSGTLTFGAGVTSQTLTIAIVNDTVVDSDSNETFTVTLSDAAGGATIGAPETAAVTIIDNDIPNVRFGATSYKVTEGGIASIAVVRANGLGSEVTASYQVTGGTATGDGTDYTLASGTITFRAGETTKMLPVPTTADTVAEGPETVIIKLVGAGGGAVVGTPDTTTLTIADNDTGGVIQFAAAAYLVAETAGAIDLIVTRAGTGLASGVTVDYAATGGSATNGGTDYGLPPGTLTFAAGENRKTIRVTVSDDGLAEGNETVVVTLSNPQGGAMLGTIRGTTLTIADNEQALQFSAANYAVTEGTASASIGVTRSGPTTATVTVICRTAAGGSAVPGTDYTDVVRTLTFGPGVRTQACLVPVLNDSALDGPKTVNLQLDTPGGPGAQLGTQTTAVLTINDNEQAGVIQFAASSYTVIEGLIAFVTVGRTGTNLAGDVTVDYAVTGGSATNGVDYNLADGTLTFGPGSLAAQIAIPTLQDTAAEGPETIVITLGNPSPGVTLGPRFATTVNITDNDRGGVIQFAASTYSVAEDAGSIDLVVTRTGTGLASGVTVDYAVTGGSATNGGTDYTLTAGTLTFAAGETRKTIPVAITNDTLPEGNETVVVTLSNPRGGATLGTVRTTTLTIREDVERFDGTYSGSYSGSGVSGGAGFTVSNGAIDVTVPCCGSGTLTSNGSATFSGSGFFEGASCTFTGRFTLSSTGAVSASGSWACVFEGDTYTGSWSAARTSTATSVAGR